MGESESKTVILYLIIVCHGRINGEGLIVMLGCIVLWVSYVGYCYLLSVLFIYLFMYLFIILCVIFLIPFLCVLLFFSSSSFFLLISLRCTQIHHHHHHHHHYHHHHHHHTHSHTQTCRSVGNSLYIFSLEFNYEIYQIIYMK